MFFKTHRSFQLLFAIASGCCFACHHTTPKEVQPAFYYWKSVFALNGSERKTVEQLGVKKLYVKFFDEVWNGNNNSAIPAAKIDMADTSFHSFTIVPVVFIANEIFYHCKDSTAIHQLAANTCMLLSQLMKQAGIHPAEIQIDCDWTATTQPAYFQLLRLVRQQLQQQGYDHFLLSATIRLYQCKYVARTGVPPADRGLLMCYNMGNLKNPSTKNSILDVKELEQYITGLGIYPLPLDVALPLFDWKVLLRQERYAGLVKDIPTGHLMNNSAVTVTGNRYTFLQDTMMDGYAFSKGDILRDEQSNYHEIVTAARIVNHRLHNQQLSVVLYHLDSVTLSKYPLHELETMFDCFR